MRPDSQPTLPAADAAAAAVAGVALVATSNGRWSALSAVALVFTVLAVARVVRALRGGDGEAALRAASLPWIVAPLLGAAARVRLGHVEFALDPVYECGNAMLAVLWLLAMVLWGGLASARFVAARAHRLHRAGWAVAVAVALAACSWTTAQRWRAARHHPTAAHWIAAQPTIARMPGRSPRDVRAGAATACGEGVCVVRRCPSSEPRCKVERVGPPFASASAHASQDARNVVAAEHALVVRRARSGVVLVQPVDGQGRPHHALAFDPTSRAQVRLELRDVRAEVAVPPGWIHGALVGSIAAAALALCGLLRRRLPGEGWRRAEHLGHGLVRFEAHDLHVEAAVTLPVGPVFARVVEADGAAYRDGRSTRVTHALHAFHDDPRACAAALDVAPLLLALTALAAFAAPLLAATLFGLA